MASQQPLTDERQIRKQQIRPRYLDLAELDDDFGEDDESFESSSRRAALGSVADWPAAATVVRKKAPIIASSSGKFSPSGGAKLRTRKVEDGADPSSPKPSDPSPSSAARQPQEHKPAATQSRSVQFAADTHGANEADAEPVVQRKATLNLAGSVVGSIQERSVGERRSNSHASTRAKPSGSRFVVRRRMDEDLQKHEEQRQKRLQQESTPDGQEPGTGFPVVSHRDHITPILPPNPDRTRQHQYSEDIDTVEAPQKDALATQAALTRPSTSTSATNQRSQTASAGDEVWLDEDGRPMSAFRKSRLLRQGLRPPSIQSIQTYSSGKDDQDVTSFRPDPSRDPGGGADIDAITAVLSEVSRENDQRLRQMSTAEVSEELRSLENLFGKDVLEALRNRKSTSKVQVNERALSKATESGIVQSESTLRRRGNSLTQEEDGEGPLAIKRQYFPGEPEGPNPSLEWMMPQPSQQAASKDLRFDFSGTSIERGVQTDQTYLSGLHHHGDDQEAPGYTVAELLHLSRSTVAAQRQLALNVLARICEHHPTWGGDNLPMSVAATTLLNDNALLLRARIISISRWLLGDRHFTVRAAALRCLVSAVRSLPAGASPPLACTQELKFGSLLRAGQSDRDDDPDRPEASEVEKGIQSDWADVMLESDILTLFWDRTDSIITSTWEAELALELLFRIASCSASHAMRVFEDDPTKFCDFVIRLGLKVAWPPVTVESPLAGATPPKSSSLPSVTAVQLLHQGILSDRKIAESLVLSGSIEHLLRFVVTPPWKVEEDWAFDDEAGDAIVVVAYQIFDEVVQLFVSLASYGLFASVVARTWDLWRAGSSWAVRHLLDHGAAEEDTSKKAWIREARNTAAQRIFEILGAWTHCASDPHELMTAHDITWTQVRDWIESVKDAAGEIETTGSRERSDQAPALGALCAYLDAWTRCATRKEPKNLPKCLEPCRAIQAYCSQPIQWHIRRIIERFSFAPTQAMALDGAEQACRACHRYLDFSLNLARADQNNSSLVPNASTAGGVSSVMLQEGLALISSSTLWQALQSPESMASGRHVYRQTFSDFVAATLCTSPEAEMTLQLAAITRLDERHASRVAQIVMSAATALSGSAPAHTLQPFLLECVIGANRMPETDHRKAVESRDDLPLSQVQSLFKSSSCQSRSKNEPSQSASEAGDEQNEDDEEDIDPITGSKLWKCPANGLPIRADWPLLPLDDLLHSGNTTVFNRPDNLGQDWKPSELEMVQESLQLAVAVFRALLQRYQQCNLKGDDGVAATAEAKAMLSSLPSPEQILLGVMKVFMLEKDQPHTFTDKTVAGDAQQMQTGSLTGRDLFRNPVVSDFLTSLLDIADELVELRRQHPKDTLISTVTLDVWTSTTYGSSMTFYQFFTDLVGLWDSVSFGDANFSRAIMTVANAGCGGIFEGDHGIAVDFRRLVWNDYSENLRSMPPTKVADWLLSWTDGDEDMLEHYCRYLAGAAETKAARQGMAWQVAAHHVGAALEKISSADSEKVTELKRRETILRSLFVARGDALLKEVLESRGGSSSANVPGEQLQRLIARLQRSSSAQ
ncbi:cytoplasmic protein [Pseudozyma hubeiensis SY62]|uniref:Cytoplasmic protein n=1 Tax=Pseudozyma hubeiensis (strain SY62) TaxID=1305764 RepID=R9NXE8_PSEHS|nr:cytoplasmic protein [Pseudozyma hubeiensis SY62]GAC93338.1 cytoplasmic protein [Pseudozyma hubeiensis SY62]